VPFLVWTKTSWHKFLKIGVSGLCLLFVVFGALNSANSRNEAGALVIQAESLVTENKLDEAMVLLNKSKSLVNSSDENPAFELAGYITKFQSPDLVKNTLVNMSDSDFSLLQEGKLESSFIGHKVLDTLFLSKLRDNADQREVYVAEVAELKKKEEAEATALEEAKAFADREKKIQSQFSSWDGSHTNLTKVIKESMNDPKSYEHIKTTYIDMVDYIIVTMEFRGKNAFGALVKNTVRASVSLDGEVLEVIKD